MNGAETAGISKLVLFVYLMYTVHTISITTLAFILCIPHIEKYVYGDAIIDLALMIFIVDACISKNIPQMKSYIILKAMSLFYFFVEGKMSSSGYSAIIFATKLVMICITLAVVGFFVKRLSSLYSWHYFKRIGANKDLRDALKTRKQLVLAFKILIVVRIKNILAMHAVLVSIYTFYILNIFYVMVAIVFLSFQRSENKKIRLFIISTHVLDEIRLLVLLVKNVRLLLSPRKM